MDDNEYQCARCGGVFVKGRSDAEARSEFEARMPHLADLPQSEMDTICDDCMVRFRAWFAKLSPAQRRDIERSGGR
jgi:hypothetical protein